MVKPLSMEEAKKLMKECLRCFSVIPGLSPSDKTEFGIEFIRAFTQQEGSERVQTRAIEKLQKYGVGLSPSIEEVHYQTSLFKEVFKHFLALIDYILARTTNDAEKISKSSMAIKTARKELKTLSATQRQSDIKDMVGYAKVACEAAAMIARSEDTNLTAIEALAIIEKGRPR